MKFLADYLRRYRSRQHVRPWALAPPILVLLLALPMLRPLRTRLPEPQGASDIELTRLAAIEAIAKTGSQAINNTQAFQILLSRNPLHPPQTVKIGDKYYSDKPPVMAALLAVAYRVMRKFGLNFHNSAPLVIYLLTLLSATLPVAGAAGLVYRMGRLFELRRSLRTALAICVVMGSGLISYAVVLNSQAPAAALILSACACLIHLVAARRPSRPSIRGNVDFCFWMILCGLCAALAAVIDLGAGFFLIGLIFVILAVRWPSRQKLGAVLLYVLGSLGPLLLHAILTMSVTGDWRPPYLHGELYAAHPTAAAVERPAPDTTSDEESTMPAWLPALWAIFVKSVEALFGSRGLLSHFPVILIGLAGLCMVLRRHWPGMTKMMAVVTLLGAIAVVGSYVVLRTDWTQAMFGPRWFIVFLPLVLFWAGPWLRQPHHPVTWSVAGVLLAFSIAVSLVGMTNPFIAAPPGRYTAAAALRQLIHPPGVHPNAQALATQE